MRASDMVALGQRAQSDGRSVKFDADAGGDTVHPRSRPPKSKETTCGTGKESTTAIGAKELCHTERQAFIFVGASRREDMWQPAGRRREGSPVGATSLATWFGNESEESSLGDDWRTNDDEEEQ